MKYQFYFSLIGAALSFQLSAQAQTENNPEIIFTGTSINVKGISNNGRYICGARMYEEAYRFDLKEKKLITIPAADSYSDMAALDVTDDGTLVGKTIRNNQPSIETEKLAGKHYHVPKENGKMERAHNVQAMENT